MNDPTEYTKTESTSAPVLAWAVWDDEAGFVTTPVATRTEAGHDLTRYLAHCTALGLAPDNARVRLVHLHDNGVERTEDPAEDCATCWQPASDYRPGDEVTVRSWHDTVFRVVDVTTDHGTGETAVYVQWVGGPAQPGVASDRNLRPLHGPRGSVAADAA